MKSTLLIVTDLGCLKAYRVVDGQLNRSPHLELVEEFTNAEAHDKLVDKVTDLAGRFPRSSGTQGGMADGERHNIQLEFRRRVVGQLAQRLNALARPPEIEQCLLAASKEINHALLEKLEPPVRAKIQKNLPADLTKVERAELWGHFHTPPPANARGA
jgi:hypothetical protein